MSYRRVLFVIIIHALLVAYRYCGSSAHLPCPVVIVYRALYAIFFVNFMIAPSVVVTEFISPLPSDSLGERGVGT